MYTLLQVKLLVVIDERESLMFRFVGLCRRAGHADLSSRSWFIAYNLKINFHFVAGLRIRII
jgi:hypothetical protein